MFIPEATFLVLMLAFMGGVLLIRSSRVGK